MATGEEKHWWLPTRLSKRFDGRGVHVVTVNDYLSKRDSEWMGPFVCSTACL